MRKLFLKKYNKKKYKKYEKIYVCRGNVKYRKVSNEKEIISFLKKKGFNPVKMTDLSVFEQAKIFNSAKIIIAPHGAALTNLVFCEKRTKVIEFFQNDYVNVCYWAVCNCLDLKYNYFIINMVGNNLAKTINQFEFNLIKLGVINGC
ncbi:MAG: glycosyltransferase family 61 protein [Candidatus ainarchaeum sp.]|nr:glycosyltransferase family 61 protein [Candidatus ainarchaeum sp.]